MAIELAHLKGQTVAVFGLARSGLATIRAAIAESLARPRDPALREHIHANYLWGEAAGKLAATSSR